MIPEMSSYFENNSVNELESEKINLVPGKYHQKWVFELLII